MEFYQDLGKYYDEVFPLSPEMMRMVTSNLPKTGKILDIGCATGQLSLALARLGWDVTGIDLDPAMVTQAQERSAHEQLTALFQVASMQEISEKLITEYNAAICVGNTLVHLADETEISLMLEQVCSHLCPGGKLIIQIINYDRILDQKIKGLPLIETENFRFERFYTVRDQHLDFKTVLSTRDDNRLIAENSIPLYPLRKKRFQRLLVNAGFSTIDFFGDLQNNPWQEDSFLTVAVAGKNQ